MPEIVERGGTKALAATTPAERAEHDEPQARAEPFRFTLTIEGADVMTDEAIAALFEAGCSDATFGVSGGVQTAAFDRVAEDFADAVGGAIAGVETAIAGARVTRVERDHSSR